MMTKTEIRSLVAGLTTSLYSRIEALERAAEDAPSGEAPANECGTIINCGFDDCAYIDRNGQCSCDGLVLLQAPGRRGFASCDTYEKREAKED